MLYGALLMQRRKTSRLDVVFLLHGSLPLGQGPAQPGECLHNRFQHSKQHGQQKIIHGQGGQEAG